MRLFITNRSASRMSFDTGNRRHPIDAHATAMVLDAPKHVVESVILQARPHGLLSMDEAEHAAAFSGPVYRVKDADG